MPTALTEATPAASGETTLSHLLDKPREQFTREDLLRVIDDHFIERITFHYTALDGKYKELKLPVQSRRQAERILAEGERVDGSSLFAGLVDVAASDLYVVPLYRSAFINPFDSASLDFTCRFLGRDGQMAAFAPDTILHKAARRLARNTGIELEALGELEFFLLGEPAAAYREPRPRNYHASAPFLKNGAVLDEMVRLLAHVTGAVKYGHAEVGAIDRIQSESEEIRGRAAEQLEIEFLPMPVEDCADALVLARWLIRTVAWRHSRIATFAPKLDEGLAGSGLHIHMQLVQHGANVMLAGAELAPAARKLIGGLCRYAASLAAFGNTQAASYLRLVPNHEAPTRVCWSDMNRSAMIRVPLGWASVRDLAAVVNPQQDTRFADAHARQTVELRSADGSALVHLLLAGICLAAESGLASRDALETAARLYVGKDAWKDARRSAELPPLPHSCAESARILLHERELYERDGVFATSIVDYVAQLLRGEDDEHFRRDLVNLPEGERLEQMRRIMHRDLHRH